MGFITVQNKDQNVDNKKVIDINSSGGSDYADHLDAIHKQITGYMPNSDKIAAATTANEASTKAATDLAKSKDVGFDLNALKNTTADLQKGYGDIGAGNAAAINKVTEGLKGVQSNGEPYKPAEQTNQDGGSSLSKAIAGMKQVEGKPIIEDNKTVIDPNSEKGFSVPEIKSISEEDFNKADLLGKAGILGHNLLASGERIGAGIANTVIHPINTANGLMMLGTGIKDVISGNNDSKEAQVIKSIWENGKYGSWDNFKKGLIEDPAGFLTDALTVVSGGAGIAAKAGQLGEVGSTLGKVGEVAGKVGDVASSLNPANVIAKTMGKVVTAPLNAVKEGGVAVMSMNAGIPKTVIDDIRNNAGPAVADTLNSAADPTSEAYKLAQEAMQNMKSEKMGPLNELQKQIDSKSEFFDPAHINEGYQNFLKTYGGKTDSPDYASLKEIMQKSGGDISKVTDLNDISTLNKISDNFVNSTDNSTKVFGQTLKDGLNENDAITQRNSQIPEQQQYNKKYGELQTSMQGIHDAFLTDAKNGTSNSISDATNKLFDAMKNNKSAGKVILQSLNEIPANKDFIGKMAALTAKATAAGSPHGLSALGGIASAIGMGVSPTATAMYLLHLASGSPVIAAKIANSLGVTEKYLSGIIERANKSAIGQTGKALFITGNQEVTQGRKGEQQIQDQTNTNTQTNTQISPPLPTNQ